MTHTSSDKPAVSSPSQPQRTLARAVGLAAFIYGYPLTEIYRTCRKQTDDSGSAPLPVQAEADGSNGSDARLPINTLHHGTRPSTHEDRDVVTPANDLLYTIGWIYLANGPMLLQLPSARKHNQRYYVVALYDAYTENFENLGPRNVDADGETVLLIGPDGRLPEAQQHLLAQYRVVRCPTDLVWLVGRVLVGDQPDWPAARALQAEITLTPGFDGGAQALPPAIRHWVGEPVDVMTAAYEEKRPAAEVAPAFFTNFCQALAEAPGRIEDTGLVAWLALAGLAASERFDWSALDAAVRQGLIEGFEDAVALVGAVGTGGVGIVGGSPQRPKPWTITGPSGRYGVQYINRARTAYRGLGALAPSEAIYAASHHDANLEPLNGQRSYRLKFNADAMPPVDAFWSVTLYGADRFLHGNVIHRHAIGDRTPGLCHESDGSLVIEIGAQRPVQDANWLPAPTGPFYLILRMYYPRDGVRDWQIPPLEVVSS